MMDIDKNRYHGAGQIALSLVLIVFLINVGPTQARDMQNREYSTTHFVPLNWYTSRITRKSAFNRLITVSFNHATLEHAIKEVAQRGHVRLSYDRKNLPNQLVTAKMENVTVMDAVDRLLSGTNMKALGSTNDQIVLVRRFGIAQVPHTALKQQETVSGRVIDSSTKEALPGVNILVKGTTVGTATDKNGNYSLNVPSLNDTLIVSYIGYKTQVIPIIGRSKINIALNNQAVTGGQLVVVGYGTQQKSTLTGSVSEVKGNSLAQAPVANISNSIAGNVAGVSMSSFQGQPGQNNPTIHIRGVSTTGNSQPLIVVDGIKRNNISEIDPSTIKSITVLKDAAAVAPYGMGGANGVILITTKNGQTGKPTFSINTEYGYSSPTHYTNMLTAQDYMRLSDEAYLNETPGGTGLPFAKSLIANYASLNAKNPDKYPITNNAGKQFENLNPPRMKTDLQMSGGTKAVTYYANLGFTNQDGMFYNVNYRRYDYTVNVDAHATPTTDVHLNLIGAIENTSSIDAAVSSNSLMTTSTLFRAGYKYQPNVNLYYSNGLWGQDAGESPIGILNSGGYNNKNNHQLLSKIMIEQQLPVQGLSAKLAFSYDPDQIFYKQYHRPFYFWSQDLSTTPPTYTKQISTSEGGSPTYTYLREEYFRAQNFTYQAYLNYKNDFGKNHITGLLVAEARNSKWNDFSAYRDHFAVNLDELNLGPSNKQDFNNSGVDSTGSQIGFVYQLGYNYDGKYLFQATGRYDGHYYFAPGHRWGFFPAFSAGWVLSEEKFIKLPSFINFLKIRGSWGKSGNLAGSHFQYLNGYDLTSGPAYAFGSGNLVQGSYIPHESNPNLTWEISKQADVGLDAHFWDDMLTVNLDYFHEKRTGMLLPPAVTVPVEYGLALSQENAGIMSNHGFEATVDASSLHIGGIRLDLSGTFSYAKNKMLQIFETSATFNNPNRRRTGRAYNTPFGLHALGLFTTADDKNGDGVIDSKDGYNVKQFGTLHPGDIKYADINGDGVINQKDNVPIGYPNTPEMTFGFTPTASWKGFDLSLLFQGSALASVNVQNFVTVPFYNNDSNASYEYYNHRWTPNHQNAKYPRATPSPNANNTQASDFWMFNAAYVRLKTAVLGYTVPQRLSHKLDIKKLRIYFSGQNLLTVSKVNNIIDPQLIVGGDGTPQYPIQKVYTLGININF